MSAYIDALNTPQNPPQDPNVNKFKDYWVFREWFKKRYTQRYASQMQSNKGKEPLTTTQSQFLDECEPTINNLYNSLKCTFRDTKMMHKDNYSDFVDIFVMNIKIDPLPEPSDDEDGVIEYLASLDE
jgi:hypothetical protein